MMCVMLASDIATGIERNFTMHVAYAAGPLHPVVLQHGKGSHIEKN